MKDISKEVVVEIQTLIKDLNCLLIGLRAAESDIEVEGMEILSAAVRLMVEIRTEDFSRNDSHKFRQAFEMMLINHIFPEGWDKDLS